VEGSHFFLFMSWVWNFTSGTELATKTNPKNLTETGLWLFPGIQTYPIFLISGDGEPGTGVRLERLRHEERAWRRLHHLQDPAEGSLDAAGRSFTTKIGNSNSRYAVLEAYEGFSANTILIINPSQFYQCFRTPNSSYL
jgi:hypothetical protein